MTNHHAPMTPDHLEFNSRMPYMPFNWFAHSARVWRLSLAERGLFDAVRSELWTVVGCKMPRDTLMARLRVGDTAPEAQMLDTLLALGLLRQDADGLVFDEVQVAEFAGAVRKSEQSRTNGASGGRPKRKEAPAPAVAATAIGDDADF